MCARGSVEELLQPACTTFGRCPRSPYANPTVVSSAFPRNTPDDQGAEFAAILCNREGTNDPDRDYSPLTHFNGVGQRTRSSGVDRYGSTWLDSGLFRGGPPPHGIHAQGRARPLAAVDVPDEPAGNVPIRSRVGRLSREWRGHLPSARTEGADRSLRHQYFSPYLRRWTSGAVDADRASVERA